MCSKPVAYFKFEVVRFCSDASRFTLHNMFFPEFTYIQHCLLYLLKSVLLSLFSHLCHLLFGTAGNWTRNVETPWNPWALQWEEDSKVLSQKMGKEEQHLANCGEKERQCLMKYMRWFVEEETHNMSVLSRKEEYKLM